MANVIYFFRGISFLGASSGLIGKTLTLMDRGKKINGFRTFFFHHLTYNSFFIQANFLFHHSTDRGQDWPNEQKHNELDIGLTSKKRISYANFNTFEERTFDGHVVDLDIESSKTNSCWLVHEMFIERPKTEAKATNLRSAKEECSVQHQCNS